MVTGHVNCCAMTEYAWANVHHITLGNVAILASVHDSQTCLHGAGVHPHRSNALDSELGEAVYPQPRWTLVTPFSLILTFLSLLLFLFPLLC